MFTILFSRFIRGRSLRTLLRSLLSALTVLLHRLFGGIPLALGELAIAIFIEFFHDLPPALLLLRRRLLSLTLTLPLRLISALAAAKRLLLSALTLHLLLTMLHNTLALLRSQVLPIGALSLLSLLRALHLLFAVLYDFLALLRSQVLPIRALAGSLSSLELALLTLPLALALVRLSALLLLALSLALTLALPLAVLLGAGFNRYDSCEDGGP